ncbi:innexin unc-9-like isoform X2 [Pomacea canaliculata]|uniref:innexin unc-9-like isoform X2 n=1 Tax=Pomacea canaliculata TaxID=400727 RepID=UPI000D7288C7|nr:innexin unc-9-like isoform X2 [Pomacea canaliculata]
MINTELHSTIRDDDGIDQLHHFVTVTLYVLCATVAGFKEYVSEPITCWNYGQYMFPHYGQHVNSYCWTQYLYQYPNESNLNITACQLDALGAPEHDTKTGVGKITFFRWVTMLFLMQAFSFKFPNMIWRELNAGSNIVKIVQILKDVTFEKKDEKRQRLQQVAFFLEQWLRIHRKPRWFMRYLSTFYLMTKALYLLNTFMQFFILSIFLHTNFFIYGLRLLNSYSEGKSDTHSKSMFPTVVMCHFRTYQDHRTTGRWVQCVLTINLFLEQLFLIEWLWLLLLLTVTTFSFIVWCFKILQTQTALKFVRHYMRLFCCVPATASKSCSVEEFVTEYLGSDGVFVLRILSVNTNEVVVSELVAELWKRYLSFKIKEVGRASPTSFQQEIPFNLGDTVDENERETGPRSSTDDDTE